MPHFFYLARCSNGSLYSGSCSDVTAREKRHNAGKGAKYTKTFGPVKIIYFESYKTQIEAMRRESQVKNWSKVKKERLVIGKHPTKG